MLDMPTTGDQMVISTAKFCAGWAFVAGSAVYAVKEAIII
jgi:hypothetical protein